MTRKGSQEPTYRWCAPYGSTLGGLASELSEAYALEPLPWQRAVLDDWLALDEDGRLLNRVCVLDVPRQNGKTGAIEPRETLGLVLRGERILHTAQEYQTAKVGFDRLRAKFGTCRNDPHAEYPELNALVDRYTTSANQMVLDLKNGGHIEFRTRGSNGDVGRGGTYDVLVIDEAQSFTDEQDQSLSPVVSAAPLGSPQAILTGTVPDPAKPLKGMPFLRLRAKLHDSPSRGECMHEWGTDELGDPYDRERWYATNPSLGHHLLLSALETDAAKMSPDGFAREHLGWWAPEAVKGTVVDEKSWKACETKDPPIEGVVCYAVKFSPDGSRGAIAACVRPDDAPPHVEIAATHSTAHGIRWFTRWLLERHEHAAQIVIDGQGQAQTLEEQLLEEGVPRRAMVRPRASDVASACSCLADAARERSMTHFNQPALDDAVTKAAKRPIGKTGGYGFESNEEADATLAEAAALALWAAKTTKRNPEGGGICVI